MKLDTGQKISAIGHVGVVAVVLFGGLFDAPEVPVQVTQVSVVSSAEFDALVNRPSAPAKVEEPITPEPKPEPEPTPEPEPVVEPEPTPEPTPEPDAPVQEAEPEPAPDTAIPDQAQDQKEIALPQIRDEAQQNPAKRISVKPMPRREQAEVADEKQEAVSEAPAPDQTPVEAKKEAAPEETATAIVPEAPKPPSGAPETSKRPKSRPAQAEVKTAEAPKEKPADKPKEKPKDKPTEKKPTVSQKSVNDALAEAMGGDDATAPSGPPLTAGEEDALRVSVQACWVVDAGSKAASVTVNVGMKMEQNGKVIADSIHLIGSEGGDDASVQVAYAAARRAILRCQKDGYNLPVEKYDHWREIEMLFDPAKMRNM